MHPGTQVSSAVESMQARPRERTVVLVLGLVSMFGPLAVDMYLPAFPAIGRDLTASATSVGWTLAVYFGGLAVGQLLIGPLSDRLGRLRPLRGGIALFLIGSAASALAPGIELLIAARALQAIGGAACAVTSRAVVRDLYRGADAARINSRLVLVMGVAPLVAPLAGGALLEVASWRAIFAAQVLVAVVAAVVVTATLRETAPPHVPRPRGADLRALASDRSFVGMALAGALAVGAMFAYITGAPFVLMTLHHVDTGDFGLFFGANVIGYIGGSQINAALVAAHGPGRLLRVGLAGANAAAFAFLVVALLDLGLWPTAGCFFVYLLSIGFVAPNAIALALEDQGSRAGNASAWIGALQFAVAAAASAAVSGLGDGTARPIAVIMVTLSLLGAGGAAIAGHPRDEVP